MDRQRVLEGERLLLRPLRAEDRAALYAVASDPQVWAQHPLPDRWREDVFAALFEELLAAGALVAIDKADGRIVGSSRYLDFEGGGLEIGTTFLACSHWGRGFNLEMKRLMLRHALASVDRVVFRVGRDNVRSRTAMTRIGARLIDDQYVVMVAGRELPHVLFEITREDFASGPLAA